jgi:hypothetical protein
MSDSYGNVDYPHGGPPARNPGAPVSDHRCAPVFSPLTYGAAGDGKTDDTRAVTAAFLAAEASGGIVYLGTSAFLTCEPLPLRSGITVAGAVLQGGQGLRTGAIINATTDLFTLSGNVAQMLIQNCALQASRGHVFNVDAAVVGQSSILGCALVQLGNDHRIWNQVGGEYIDMLVGDNSFLICSGGATVSPWYILNTDTGCNSNTWRRMRLLASHANTPFFHIENRAPGGPIPDNVFSEFTAEECDGGIIHALSCSYLTIKNVSGYDTTTYTGSIFSIGTAPGGIRSGWINIRNSGRKGGGLAAGAYDVEASSDTEFILLENVGPETGQNPSFSVPPGHTTIIGLNTVNALQAPAMTAAGINDATAASRYAGATTGGHPTSGTFLTGDFVVDQTGNIWVCTAGGTPGTWVSMR